MSFSKQFLDSFWFLSSSDKTQHNFSKKTFICPFAPSDKQPLYPVCLRMNDWQWYLLAFLCNNLWDTQLPLKHSWEWKHREDLKMRKQWWTDIKGELTHEIHIHCIHVDAQPVQVWAVLGLLCFWGTSFLVGVRHATALPRGLDQNTHNTCHCSTIESSTVTKITDV